MQFNTQSMSVELSSGGSNIAMGEAEQRAFNMGIYAAS